MRSAPSKRIGVLISDTKDWPGHRTMVAGLQRRLSTTIRAHAAVARAICPDFTGVSFGTWLSPESVHSRRIVLTSLRHLGTPYCRLGPSEDPRSSGGPLSGSSSPTWARRSFGGPLCSGAHSEKPGSPRATNPMGMILSHLRHRPLMGASAVGAGGRKHSRQRDIDPATSEVSVRKGCQIPPRGCSPAASV